MGQWRNHESHSTSQEYSPSRKDTEKIVKMFRMPDFLSIGWKNYKILYHNRAKRLLKNGGKHANELVQVLKHTSTTVIAASLKSPEEVVEARLAGVPILSTNFEVLSKKVQHDLSESALKEFNQTGIGLISQ